MSSGDADAAEKFFSEKSEFTDMATGMTMRGVDENLMDVKNWMSTFSDMKVTALRHVESGNVVATEMQFEGTNTGEMAMPDGSKYPQLERLSKCKGAKSLK